VVVLPQLVAVRLVEALPWRVRLWLVAPRSWRRWVCDGVGLQRARNAAPPLSEARPVTPTVPAKLELPAPWTVRLPGMLGL